MNGQRKWQPKRQLSDLCPAWGRHTAKEKCKTKPVLRHGCLCPEPKGFNSTLLGEVTWTRLGHAQRAPQEQSAETSISLLV